MPYQRNPDFQERTSVMNEELKRKIDTLRQEYDGLLNEVAMADVTRQLGDTATQITGLPGKIKEIRDAGYAYANYLENKVQTLDRQWADIRLQIEMAIHGELMNAQQEINELDSLWDQLEQALSANTPAAAPKPRTGGLSAILKAVQEQKEGQAAATGGMLAALQRAATAPGGTTASIGAMLNKTGISEARVKTLADQLDSAMDRVKSKLDAAKQRIRGLYGQIPSNVSQTYSQLRDIETYLERTQNATFEFNAAEDVYMVTKAEWKDGKDNPTGFLYITNQRLIMEQTEKKGGFLGFGGKKVESLLWAAPIGAVEKVDFEKKGMLGRIDLIHLRFGTGGPAAETTIELHEGGVSAKWFASKLQQAVSGEIEKERGLQRDQALVEAIADAPTICPICGATFDQEIKRGMTQLQCSYCSSIVRLGIT
jgi:predicted  nucleic acid-binding Zn-ribbon protein